MCKTCGCGQGPEHDHDETFRNHEHAHDHRPLHRKVALELDLLAKNDRLAMESRVLLARSGVRMFNVVGAPGAGKTSLLEVAISRLRAELPLYVLEGDQATDLDAKRIERAGCRVVQINTDAGCHLDASMVSAGIAELAPRPGSVILVENVGNLVCPALFDVGENAKIAVMSVTEGADKPLKYPHIFRAASLFVLTKADLLPHVDFDVEQSIAWALEVNPNLEVMLMSATTGEGVDHWCGFIRRQMES